jgi:hypothetical protein
MASCSFPKHNIRIIGIWKNAIVATIEWTTLNNIQIVDRLEAGSHTGIGKPKHGVFDNQQAARLERSGEIGHGFLEVGEADVVVASRRRR